MYKLVRIFSGLLGLVFLWGFVFIVKSGKSSEEDFFNKPGFRAISNPAAYYCQSLGYTYEIEDTDQGEQGVCYFPDGATCSDWDFLQGECGQDKNHCAKQGLKTKVKQDGKNKYSKKYAVCVDKDGKEKGSVTELMDFENNLLKSGCGQTAELSPEQKEEKNLGSNIPPEAIQPKTSSTGALPTSLDWHNYLGSDWMTPVKNQGWCGSCWGFSAVGAVEAAYNIAHNNPNLDLDLSEEYLVSDCSAAGSCCGGWHESALSFIRDYGIPDEGCLPYADSGCSCWGTGICSCPYNIGGCSNRTCSDRCTDYSSRLKNIDSYMYLSPDVTNIKQALVDGGPISVALTMNGVWDGDIYRCPDDYGADHVVVMTGYEDAGGYWIVKNSWGNTWNEDGYFFVGYDECSIQNYAYLPLKGLPVLPDLVVESITFSPSTPAVGQPVNFTVHVRNQGTGDANGTFRTDFYINHQGTGCSDYGDQSWEVNSLAAGAAVDLMFTYPGFNSSGTYWVWAYADSGCGVSESDENNNNVTATGVTISQDDMIFSDGFESGNLLRWSSSKTDGVDLRANGKAKYSGTYGMEAKINDNEPIYVADENPNSEPRYRAHFYFHPNSIKMDNGNTHAIFYGYQEPSKLVLRVDFRFYSSKYQIRAGFLEDGGGWKYSSWYAVRNDWNDIEFDWRAAASAGANNGGVTLWINGTHKVNLTTYDNDLSRIDMIRLGPVADLDKGTHGKYYFDDFVSRRQNSIGPVSATQLEGEVLFP